MLLFCLMSFQCFVQVETEILEMTTYNDLLRVAVEDKDTPQTKGWRVNYFFIGGNELEMFSIKTDPKTNEGILSVVKVAAILTPIESTYSMWTKLLDQQLLIISVMNSCTESNLNFVFFFLQKHNYIITTTVSLQIGVKNEENLCLCKDQKLICDAGALPPPDSMNITIKVIDSNDPPTFEKETVNVYQKEESEAGQTLFIPDVADIDSTDFKYGSLHTACLLPVQIILRFPEEILNE